MVGVHKKNNHAFSVERFGGIVDHPFVCGHFPGKPSLKRAFIDALEQPASAETSTEVALERASKIFSSTAHPLRIDRQSFLSQARHRKHRQRTCNRSKSANAPLSYVGSAPQQSKADMKRAASYTCATSQGTFSLHPGRIV